jgi:hypothetical protein
LTSNPKVRNEKQLSECSQSLGKKMEACFGINEFYSIMISKILDLHGFRLECLQEDKRSAVLRYTIELLIHFVNVRTVILSLIGLSSQVLSPVFPILIVSVL